MGEKITPPLVSDGIVYEVLGLLHAFRTDLEPPAPNVVPLKPRRRGTLIALSAAMWKVTAPPGRAY